MFSVSSVSKMQCGETGMEEKSQEHSRSPKMTGGGTESQGETGQRKQHQPWGPSMES